MTAKNSIAKNTMFLYFRMLVTLFISLFTSRIILNSLGETDYGIYNVVGGFVTMFNVFCSGLATTTQRFLNFDLGKNDKLELHRTFSSCAQIYFFISIIIIILAETGGVWFLGNKMTIPTERMYAAKWVFQLAIITLVFNLISIPYNALIIAHERMKAFAYISVYEAVAKLLIAYLIYNTNYDRLILYALLLCCVQLSVRFIYTNYCKRHFEGCSVDIKIDLQKIKELYSFAGWAMFGGLSSIGFTQGLNVLLNMFFSPAVNAARAVAVQVQNAVNNFAINFQVALNPQIIKSYASGDTEYMYKLVFASSKYSFLLLYMLSLPLLMEAPQIMVLWLKNVPEYSVIFLRLIMLTSIIDAMSNPFMRTADATGNIRTYQLVIGVLLLMILPISYIVLKLGYPPYSVFIVHITICITAFIARLFIVQKLIYFSIRKYFKEVILKVIIVGALSPIIPLFIIKYNETGFIRLAEVTCLSILITAGMTYFVALSDNERNFIHAKVRSIWSK